MSNTLSRRQFVAASGMAICVAATGPAFGFSAAQAETKINSVVKDINKIIGSGASESRMIQEFDKVFGKYADIARIGQLVLGPPARTASASQRSKFAKAFQGYMARKYGSRFREFIGGSVSVEGTRTVKSFYEVTTIAQLAGEAPFEVVFVVADENGLFIDMKIEGISLIKAERSEVGALLDQRKGDLDRLIADLPNLG